MEHREKLDVFFFNPAEGLDQKTRDEFTAYMAKLKRNFEISIHKLSDENYDLKQRVAIYEN